MLRFLLDEHLPKLTARLVREWRPGISIWTLAEWQGGGYLGKADEVILETLAPHGFTLVTYDKKTIIPLVTQWALERRMHAGVVVVDQRTIHSMDAVAIARALVALHDGRHELDWSNRTWYLQRAG